MRQDKALKNVPQGTTCTEEETRVHDFGPDSAKLLSTCLSALLNQGHREPDSHKNQKGTSTFWVDTTTYWWTEDSYMTSPRHKIYICHCLSCLHGSDGFYEHERAVTIVKISFTLFNITVRKPQKLRLHIVLLSAFLCSSNFSALWRKRTAASLCYVRITLSVFRVSMFMFILNARGKKAAQWHHHFNYDGLVIFFFFSEATIFFTLNGQDSSSFLTFCRNWNISLLTIQVLTQFIRMLMPIQRKHAF